MRASPFVPRPTDASSLTRSNPESFQSSLSVTTTAAALTPPCTSAQSLERNDTAVAI
jgi:hypothetical protein